MVPRGDFKKTLKQTSADGQVMYEKLKRLEGQMEAKPFYMRPRVKMEPGKGERNYPPTSKYDYVSPNQPNMDKFIERDLLSRKEERLKTPPPDGTKSYRKGGMVKEKGTAFKGGGYVKGKGKR